MKKKTCRGLQCISVAKRKKIAAMGGKKSHELGKAPKFTTKTARKAVAKRWLFLNKKV